MKSIGICGKITDFDKLNYEKSELYSEAKKAYCKVILIDPRLVLYKFIRGAKNPVILYNDDDISFLSSLIVRSTKDQEAAIAVLVRSLKMCGCDVLDPIGRFSVGKASKLLTTISRFENGVGTSTYISFTRSGAKNLLLNLNKDLQFPLLAKPVSGKQGKGVIVINSYIDGIKYINSFFKDDEYTLDPFFLQNFISFQNEYRILVIDGVALGMAEKIKTKGKNTANAAQGAAFVKVDLPDIINETLQNVSNEGIIGVDVAVDINGYLHIIEMNRAPQWQAFEKATGVNVARAIIERAIQRIK